MLGSHNTFSYLPAKSFLKSLLKKWWRCQDKDIATQYNAGLRYFDLRVNFDKKGKLQIVHNDVVFKIDKRGFLNEMTRLIEAMYNNSDKVYFRIVLDERKMPKKVKEANQKVAYFLNFIQMFSATYPKITIDDVRIFWNWKNPVKRSSFNNIYENHVSVRGTKAEYLLGTKAYADKVRNDDKEIIASEKDVILKDYVC